MFFKFSLSNDLLFLDTLLHVSIRQQHSCDGTAGVPRDLTEPFRVGKLSWVEDEDRRGGGGRGGGRGEEMENMHRRKYSLKLKNSK